LSEKLTGLKKKIILLGTIWPYRSGGIATFNERLTRALLEHGDEVINYTIPPSFFPAKPSFLISQPRKGWTSK
jgi:D-inositol-3-phosphate glycosyltransferase